MGKITVINQIVIFHVIFVVMLCVMFVCSKHPEPSFEDKIIIPTVSFFCCSILFITCYQVPYSINKKQIVLTEKISNSYVIAATTGDNSSLRYINESGKETSLELNKDTDIYHKKGKENKITFEEIKYRSLLGFFECNETNKVTIYKK